MTVSDENCTTELNLFPCFERKTVNFTERIAYGEHVRVYVHGVTQNTGLRVRIRYNGVDVAVCTDFSNVSGNSCHGMLNLFTSELSSVFKDLPDRSCLCCTLIVDTLVDTDVSTDVKTQSLFASSPVSVSNWPDIVLEGTPTGAGNLSDTVDALKTKVEDHLSNKTDDHGLATIRADIETLQTQSSSNLSTISGIGVRTENLESGLKAADNDITTNAEGVSDLDTKLNGFKESMADSIVSIDAMACRTMAETKAKLNALVLSISSALSKL